MDKGRAAEQDLETIAEHGTQAHAQWLVANWGNDGVTPATNEPSALMAGTAAIANTAQNIVMLVNEENPDRARDEDIQRGVAAASLLTSFIGGDKNVNLTTEEANQLRDAAITGLRKAAEATTLKDKQGNEIALDDFILERGKEIDAGIEERQEQKQKKTTEAGQENDGQTLPPAPLSQRVQRHGQSVQGVRSGGR
jgi:hypothetical protein